MVTDMLGDPQKFSVEWCNTKEAQTSMLALRIWISGLPLGTLEEETYLPSFLHNLNLLVDVQSKNGVKSNSSINRNQLISLGETFDDFIVHRYFSQGNVVIEFGLIKKPFFYHPLLVSGKRYKAEIPIDTVTAVISEFRSTR